MTVCPGGPGPWGGDPAGGAPFGVLVVEGHPPRGGRGGRGSFPGEAHPHGPPCPSPPPPAPSSRGKVKDTSKLHISSDMKAPSFGGEAAVNGAKLCVSGFCDVIYYRSLGTELRPSTHFS